MRCIHPKNTQVYLFVTRHLHVQLKSFMPKFRNIPLIQPIGCLLNHSNTPLAHFGRQYPVKHHTLASKVTSSNNRYYPSHSSQNLYECHTIHTVWKCTKHWLCTRVKQFTLCESAQSTGYAHWRHAHSTPMISHHPCWYTFQQMMPGAEQGDAVSRTKSDQPVIQTTSDQGLE